MTKYIRNQPINKTVDLTKDSRKPTNVVKIRSTYFVQFNLARSLKKIVRVEKLKRRKHNKSYFNTIVYMQIYFLNKLDDANFLFYLLSVLAVHRPLYISICISSLTAISSQTVSSQTAICRYFFYC